MSETRSGSTILVVEDDESLRTQVVDLLVEAGFESVGVASGEAALLSARAHPPAAVVLDVCLPGVSGYEVCRTLKEEQPGTPVLFVSGERMESFDRVAGLLIGADDYLVKPFAHDELLARLRGLLRRAEAAPGARGLRGLTRRELEVLRHLAEGLGQSEIAKVLVISPKTVGTHIEHIFDKLGVRSRAQAVAAAYRERLVEADVTAHDLVDPDLPALDGLDAGLDVLTIADADADAEARELSA
jgi:two-component system, LuxR family, response regulator FixJ